MNYETRQTAWWVLAIAGLLALGVLVIDLPPARRQVNKQWLGRMTFGKYGDPLGIHG